jgi:hypothetical protein
MLSQDDQTMLNDIRYHWQDAYYVNFADGVWSAVPFDDRTILLTADTGMELRDKIRYDYAERAIRRQERVLGDAGRTSRWPAGNSGP